MSLLSCFLPLPDLLVPHSSLNLLFPVENPPLSSIPLTSSPSSSVLLIPLLFESASAATIHRRWHSAYQWLSLVWKSFAGL